jgi:hypothetical protein
MVLLGSHRLALSEECAMVLPLLILGLVGLFFVYGYFPPPSRRHPSDAKIASFVTICSAIMLGVVTIILLTS